MYHAGLNFFMLTPGNVHDTQAMDSLPVEAGAYYLMDKGYYHCGKFFLYQISDISFYFEGGDGDEGLDTKFYIDLYIIIIIYKSKLQEALKEGVARIKLISDI